MTSWRSIRQRERRFSDPHLRNRALAGEEESLDEWAARLWHRIDRDRNGFITSKELDCQEFHNILRAAVAPVTGTSTGGATLCTEASEHRGLLFSCAFVRRT